MHKIFISAPDPNYSHAAIDFQSATPFQETSSTQGTCLSRPPKKITKAKGSCWPTPLCSSSSFCSGFWLKVLPIWGLAYLRQNQFFWLVNKNININMLQKCVCQFDPLFSSCFIIFASPIAHHFIIRNENYEITKTISIIVHPFVWH